MTGDYEIKGNNFSIKSNRVEEFLTHAFFARQWDIFDNSEVLKKEVREFLFLKYEEYENKSKPNTDYYNYLCYCLSNFLIEKINNNEINRHSIIDSTCKELYSNFSDLEMKCVLIDMAFLMSGYLTDPKNITKYNINLDLALINSGVKKENLELIKFNIRRKIYYNSIKLSNDDDWKLTLG